MPIYDSRAFVHRLTEAGMSEGQADTLANENLLLIAEHLATKDDLKALEASLRSEMAQLRTELMGEMAQLRTEMRSEMRQLETRLSADMHDLQLRVTVRLGALMVAILTVFKLLE